MGRSMPIPVVEDFNRARGLIEGAGETQVIALAQLIAENRWLSNIIHAGVFNQSDLDESFQRGFKEGSKTLKNETGRPATFGWNNV